MQERQSAAISGSGHKPDIQQERPLLLWAWPRKQGEALACGVGVGADPVLAPPVCFHEGNWLWHLRHVTDSKEVCNLVILLDTSITHLRRRYTDEP